MDYLKKYYQNIILTFLVIIITQHNLISQVTVKEYFQELETYNFHDPDPVPIFIKNPKIYPYFTFDGYSTNSILKKFKVVEIENKYIKVYILPEVGGKVWGAIDKTSGEEFIYKNEVVKYRNISMRGPWTSGGIEFNFGIIGHHPSTATPVDYLIKKNDDESISCFVGNIDLPSRSQWRVEIKVKNNQASFLTNALWYNPTPINQSYYNWMTAAAPAREDLEFFTPGHLYLEHSGNVKNWPFDIQGRDLSKYKNNNFGPSKSYHIVGEYNDFFGGYYKNSGYGFGHWGKYEEIPGQKLWLWSQSRAGGIWEDLLTDNDGQYIEFQAGRLLVQYQPTKDKNPISNVNFEPYAVDKWSEAWFPLRKIEGLSEASEYGALHVQKIKNNIQVKINPFIEIDSEMIVLVDDKIHYQEKISLSPMDIFTTEFKVENDKKYEININDLDLHYISDKSVKRLDRSFSSDNSGISTDQRLLLEAKENISYRQYDEAKEKLEKLIEKDKYNLEAISYLGELYYRSGLYDKSLNLVKEGLQIDTYHPSLNYIAGISYKKLGDLTNSKESLGWAARSIKYRSNAYSQIADIYLKEKKFIEAIKYANKSLEYNLNNIPSLEVIAISYRYLGNRDKHKLTLKRIQDIDPIHHIITFEKYLENKNEKTKKEVLTAHQSELTNQSYLELAIGYYNRGLEVDAIKALNFSQEDIINNIWLSYLTKDPEYLKSILSIYKIDFAFPFRNETIKALNWAREKVENWKLDYLLALNLYGKNRYNESVNLLMNIGDGIENSIFFLNKAEIIKKNGFDPGKELERAYDLDKKNWRISRSISEYYFDRKEFNKSTQILGEAYRYDKKNYIIGMNYVKSLVKQKKYMDAISILDEIEILPYEHAGEGRDLYSSAYLGLAMKNILKSNFEKAVILLNESKKWPENLGVGKPYDPDERIENYLLNYSFEKLKMKNKENLTMEIIDFSYENIDELNANHIIGYIVLEREKGENAANQFLKDLIEIHGDESEEIKFIIDYKENNFNESFEFLNKIKLLD